MRQDDNRKIRIGLLLEGLNAPAWVARLVELLLASEDAEVRLVVLLAPADSSDGVGSRAFDPAGRAGLGKPRRNPALVDFYLDFEEQQTAPPRPDAFRPIDLAPALAGVMTMELPPAAALDGAALDHAADRVASLDLDVLLDLTGRGAGGRMVRAARCGLWRLAHGDPEAGGGGPLAGLAEVFQHSPVTGSALELAGAAPEETLTLLRAWSATDPRSVRHNRHHLYWKTLHLVPRALRELRRLGPTRFMVQARQADAALRFHAGGLGAIRGSLGFVRPLVRHLGRCGAARLAGRFAGERGFLLVAEDRPAPERDLAKFRKLQPPPGRFWSDPFVFFKDGRYAIFFSENRLSDDQRHIAVITQGEDGRWSAPALALERPHDLAYPFIFKWDGAIYMIPSAPEARAVELYRCTGWPGDWEFVRNLVSGAWASRATLHPHGGKWWLFLNMTAGDEAALGDELHLFYADSPLSDRWTPHPRNPVVADARQACPAGRLFEWGSALYRPARAAMFDGGVNGGRIGRSPITLNRVLKLTEEAYEEVAVETIAPGWDAAVQGVRTLNFTGRVTVLDAVRRVWKISK